MFTVKRCLKCINSEKRVMVYVYDFLALCYTCVLRVIKFNPAEFKYCSPDDNKYQRAITLYLATICAIAGAHCISSHCTIPLHTDFYLVPSSPF